MTQKNLSARLKALILFVSAAIAFCTIFLLPLSAVSPNFDETHLFCILFWSIAAVPCGIALAFSWRIAHNIGCDRSFSKENALLLKRISTLAAADAGYLLCGSILRRFLCGDPIAALLLSIVIAALGVVLSAAFAALSHLVTKAALLQEETDLTI